MAGERQEGELSHIIAKFAGELIEDEDDEEQVYDPDEEKKKILGCTQFQVILKLKYISQVLD